MSTTPDRPNFFILLELDPDAPWNQADFEIRLKEKQMRWARETNSPRIEVKNNASRNLQLVREIRHLMTDNDFWRGEEANDARQQLAQLRLARLARLDSAIEFYKNDGYITRKEFDALLRDYGDVISASDLRVRVGVVIRDNTEQTLGLEPAVAQRIRANLAFLGEDSLYTLLRWEASKGVNPSVQPLGPFSLSSDLVAAARNLHKRMLERMDISPENTARKHLAGEAMVIFADEKKRRQYDTTLRLEPLDILIKEIERLCLPEGKITPQRANVFYWKAREKGFPTADAEAALNKLIHDKKWPPIVPDDPIEQLNKATTTRHTQLSIFVSHSHQDAAFCQELVVALRAAGANVWYDEHNMGSGQLTPTIERELRARSIFVVILSPSAIQSQWVAEETLWAYNLYRGENTRTILPVLAAPVNERDIWLFLQNFKRIELPGGQPYPKAEAIGRVVAAMQAIA